MDKVEVYGHIEEEATPDKAEEDGTGYLKICLDGSIFDAGIFKKGDKIKITVEKVVEVN